MKLAFFTSQKHRGCVAPSLVAAFAFAACGAAPANSQPALDLAAAFPAPGAMNVCPDTLLRLTFATPPTLGGSGKIRIVDVATGADIETIDTSSPTATKTIGGLDNFKYHPVIVAENTATIFPRNGALAYGKTYAVVIDVGVFKNGDAAYAGIDKPDTWRFTTKSAPPKAGTTRLVVAADGTGDFCTVQGAIDFIPDGNTTPTTIFLKKGTYTEIVCFTNKHSITLLGEDRKQSVIAYANNAAFNPGGGNPFGGAAPNPAAENPRRGGNVYRRGMFLAHRVNDLTIANLTLRNTTPQGGSQAEAIILNGTTSAHAILKDVDLYSFQDTLQINGQAYLENCFIQGDVDFMWGTGPCFFENCTARSLRSGAYYTQIRNPGTNHGYVFHRCTFDGAPGIMGNYFSRIGTGRFPNSEVVLLDCTLGNAVGPVAWQFQGSPREGNENDPANVHFWEFNSRDAAGKPAEVSQRLAGSRQLKQPDDAKLIAEYSNPTFVLGGDWNPKAAPIFANSTTSAGVAKSAAGAPVITTQPATRELALLGMSPSFVVRAAGTGKLSYQWFKNGTPISGATSETLRLGPARWESAANYTVTISNAAGSVTSNAAELLVLAPATSSAPQLPAVSEKVFDATTFGARGDGATDNTAALQKAIDAAVAAGGGVVAIPAASKPYLSGPITLGNGVNLQIETGATLQALPYSANAASKPAGFYPLEGERFADFISARNAHDLAITGGGTINGDGSAWWAAFRANKSMPHRPYLVRFTGCERALVTGITLTNSPMFHFAPGSTNHLTIFGITIDSPEAPNTDGLDPSGSHQLIQNCVISCGDDNIAVKAGGTFCSDITIADCEFGLGHGLSVGGQSNSGLDGMTVKNCTFRETTSGLRLKADATQGGPVQNISYTNLVMQDVRFPIVFYSYYNKVGNPGATSGSTQTTAEKIKAWNATPPNALASKTLPSWKNITVSNLIATGSTGYSTIWGLPLDGFFIDNVKLNNVRIIDSPGLVIGDATNVQFTGRTDIAPLVACNALAITRQPQNQSVATGASVTFFVATAGASGVNEKPPAFQWTFDGAPLADGKRDGGSSISGATTATLKIENATSADAGKYAVVVSNALDAFDVAANALAPGSAKVSATSSAATLAVGAP